MSFIVSARSSSGEVRFRRDSMLAAFDKGLALLSVGMEQVQITDLAGRSFSPVEFSRVFLERRDAKAELVRAA